MYQITNRQLQQQVSRLYSQNIRIYTIKNETVPRGWSLYVEASPERGTFFRLSVHNKVGISQVTVCERVLGY